MNQIMANIKSRRSRRDFIDRSIPEGLVEEIIEAGRYAPSALNRQTWKFIIITNKDCIKGLSRIVKGITEKLAKYLALLKLLKPALRDPQIVGAIKKTLSADCDRVFHNAPLLILIVSDKKEPYAAKDCSMAAQNMMLYANSVGIGSCFVGRAEILERSREAREIIGLPHNHKIQSAIVFGYATRDENGPNRRNDNILKWVR